MSYEFNEGEMLRAVHSNKFMDALECRLCSKPAMLSRADQEANGQPLSPVIKKNGIEHLRWDCSLFTP